MAGLMLIAMGLTGLGTAVKFIPRPITIGFTNGIAVLIASTQIKDFLGLQIGAVPSEFVARMSMLAKNISKGLKRIYRESGLAGKGRKGTEPGSLPVNGINEWLRMAQPAVESVWWIVASPNSPNMFYYGISK